MVLSLAGSLCQQNCLWTVAGTGAQSQSPFRIYNLIEFGKFTSRGSKITAKTAWSQSGASSGSTARIEVRRPITQCMGEHDCS